MTLRDMDWLCSPPALSCRIADLEYPASVNVGRAELENRVYKVCIFGKTVGAALHGTGAHGGAELQMALIAKTLALHGIGVKVIDPEVSDSFAYHANLAIQGIPKWNQGIRGLRLFSHRIPNLIRSLRATHARVYYARGFSFLYLLPLFVAKRTGPSSYLPLPLTRT